MTRKISVKNLCYKALVFRRNDRDMISVFLVYVAHFVTAPNKIVGRQFIIVLCVVTFGFMLENIKVFRRNIGTSIRPWYLFLYITRFVQPRSPPRRVPDKVTDRFITVLCVVALGCLDHSSRNMPLLPTQLINSYF